MKLLEKTMDRRYKSTNGLRMDLENCLQQWEANGDCERFRITQQDGPLLLEINLDSLDQPITLSERTEFETSETSNGYSQVLELAAVMRASQAFSEETDSYHLLSKLMSILIEVAGAQRGCFVAIRSAELYVEQIVEAESREQPLRGGIPLSQYENVCQNLISYVAIKRHFVILEDAVREGLFTQDPYVQLHKPKSVLGLPIIAQGELQGVLYLENNLTSGVFAADRLGVLHMLASQINYVQRLLGYYGSSQSIQEPKIGGALTSPIVPLTEREIEVLQWMAAGLSNKEIAVRLVMSAGTVKVHMRNLFSKLHVNNRVKAVTVATQLNLLQATPIAE